MEPRCARPDGRVDCPRNGIDAARSRTARPLRSERGREAPADGSPPGRRFLAGPLIGAVTVGPLIVDATGEPLIAALTVGVMTAVATAGPVIAGRDRRTDCRRRDRRTQGGGLPWRLTRPGGAGCWSRRRSPTRWRCSRCRSEPSSSSASGARTSLTIVREPTLKNYVAAGHRAALPGADAAVALDRARGDRGDRAHGLPGGLFRVVRRGAAEEVALALRHHHPVLDQLPHPRVPVEGDPRLQRRAEHHAAGAGDHRRARSPGCSTTPTPVVITLAPCLRALRDPADLREPGEDRPRAHRGGARPGREPG